MQALGKAFGKVGLGVSRLAGFGAQRFPTYYVRGHDWMLFSLVMRYRNHYSRLQSAVQIASCQV